MSDTEYHQGKMSAFLQMIVAIIKKHPEQSDNIDFIKAAAASGFPALKDRSKCPNCEASMREYTYTFDAWDALLLLRMAHSVRERLVRMPFNIANQVHVPELKTSHAVKCRTTQASKLGLVAQLRNKDGARVSGTWVITRRGWDALKGEPVPQKVKVWRKKIEERYEETITLAEALKSHVDSVRQAVLANRTVKEDHRDFIAIYKPSDWYEYGFHTGSLFD